MLGGIKRRSEMKTSRRRGIRGFESLESRVVLTGATLITEFLAVNDRVLADKDDDSSDWIELHNPGPDEANLEGSYLTDDADELTKWRFPALTLPADGYLVVFASGKNLVDASTELHTNFKLSGDGEYLALVGPDGTTISQQFAPGFPAQSADISYGLSPDLSTEVFFVTPTPGAKNDEGLIGVADPVSFNVQRGFFDAPFSLEITTPTSEAQIRYTLDGSVPGPGNGRIYDGPIQVESTTMIRAQSVKDGYLSSEVATHTYLFAADVLTQTKPEGYPDLRGPGRYGVDPATVDVHRDTLIDDLKAVPTISLVTSVDDMFGPNGTYMDGSDDKPTSVEMIFPDGREGFQIDAGVRQQGGTTRGDDFPKHAFRLKFTANFGPTKLEFPLFEDSPVTQFDTVILRANAQDGWQLREAGKDQQIKDEFARRSQLAMGSLSAHGRFVHVYVNGLYWGVYNLVERPDAAFVSQHLGGARSDWDALNAGRVRDGNSLAWDAMLALAPTSGTDIRNNFDEAKTAENYAAIQEYLDIPSFIDYIVLGTYLGTSDWLPNNNYEARRSRDGDGPVDPNDPNSVFRFFHWDQEASLLGIDVEKNLPGFLSPVGRMYQLFRRVDEFVELQAQRIFDHMHNGGALTPEANAARYQTLIDEVEDALNGEAIRWGGGPDTMAQWRAEADQLINSYFPNRRETVIAQFRRFKLYPSIDPPMFSQHGGKIGPNAVVDLTAMEGDIYYTTDGSDPKMADGTVSPTAVLFSDSISVTEDTVVRVRALSGEEWSVRNEAAFEFVTDLPLAGDFDDNLTIDVNDVDLLCQAIRSENDESRFDLTGDNVVNHADLENMIDEVIGTQFGDANLDGRFDSADLIALAASGHYEDQEVGNSSWATGDFDCDGEFSSSDLVLALQRGGFSRDA